MAVAAIWLRSNSLINRTYDVQVGNVAFPMSDAAAIERGRHLVDAVGTCRDCHGPDLAGAWIVDEPIFARIKAANITPAGAVAGYTDADWVRVLRHGVRPDGRSVVVMPSEAYRYLSDADLTALVAYLRSVPPVEGLSEGMIPGPIARVLLATGEAIFIAEYIKTDTMPAPTVTTADTTAAYGYYLAQVSGCIGCHGQALDGGPIPGGDPDSPPAANITPGGIGSWNVATFDRAMREGIGPAGRTIDISMPRRGAMTEAEILALWNYLRSIPARELGT